MDIHQFHLCLSCSNDHPGSVRHHDPVHVLHVGLCCTVLSMLQIRLQTVTGAADNRCKYSAIFFRATPVP